MKESGTNQNRISIQYFDGVNSTVQQTIATKTELIHAENARSKVIGVLDKREGQTVVGTDNDGAVFISEGDYGLTYFEDGGSLSKGLLRVSSVDGVTANIYYLNTSDVWTKINNDMAINLSLNNCTFANVDSNILMVNGVDPNRMIIGEIGVTTNMSTSASPGSLFNSPISKNIASYKSRIYVADYCDNDGNELKTTVLRSSYPMGLISLLDGDLSSVDGNNEWVLKLTDTKYIYTDTGMNLYDIYRGNNKIASITIKDADSSSITANSYDVTFESGYSSFLSADELWISGTFTGEKQYRWVSNSYSVGRDVKQYDTFKLVGGDEDAITMLVPIGNILMIANRNALMTWNDYSLENFDMNVGCCSRNGYVKNGALYFLRYSGIYVTSGGVPSLLSRKIERYIGGATKAGLESGAMGSKGLSIFCTIGDVTLYKNDGSLLKVLPKVCVEYATADQNWYIHTNVTSTMFKTYLDSSGVERLTMNSISLGRNAVLGDELINDGSFSDTVSSWEYSDPWDKSSNNMTLLIP